jgi:hypothetical protein
MNVSYVLEPSVSFASLEAVGGKGISYDSDYIKHIQVIRQAHRV